VLSSLFDVVVVSREGEGVIVLFLRPFPAVRLLKNAQNFSPAARPKNSLCKWSVGAYPSLLHRPYVSKQVLGPYDIYIYILYLYVYDI